MLAALTRNNATFTERELDRYLAKHLGAGSDGTPDAAQVQDIAAAKAAVMGHKDVLMLHDRETGEAAGRFSTRTVREQEGAALADGAAVAVARHHQGVKARHQETALGSRTLREDQRAAFEHTVEGGGLKLIEGRAGTGKSYTGAPWACLPRQGWRTCARPTWARMAPPPRWEQRWTSWCGVE